MAHVGVAVVAVTLLASSSCKDRQGDEAPTASTTPEAGRSSASQPTDPANVGRDTRGARETAEAHARHAALAKRLEALPTLEPPFLLDPVACREMWEGAESINRELFDEIARAIARATEVEREPVIAQRVDFYYPVPTERSGHRLARSTSLSGGVKAGIVVARQPGISTACYMVLPNSDATGASVLFLAGSDPRHDVSATVSSPGRLLIERSTREGEGTVRSSRERVLVRADGRIEVQLLP